MLSPTWRLVGAQSLDGTPQEIVEVFPCHGYCGTAGVGFRTVQGHRCYVWTRATGTVRDACRRQGFAVSTEIQGRDPQAPGAA